jgi:ATP-dependent Lon protease
MLLQPNRKHFMAETCKRGDTFLLPVLPLKNVVAYPKNVIPVIVGRDISMRAVEFALKESREVFVVAQRSADIEVPGRRDIYHEGTRAVILQVGRLANNTLRILIEGVSRSEIVEFDDSQDFLYVQAEDKAPRAIRSKVEEKAMSRSLINAYKEYLEESDKPAPDVMSSLLGLEHDLDYVIDTIASQMHGIDLDERQKILETVSLKKRAVLLSGHIYGEVEVLRAERTIRQRVQDQVEKNQKDYYLNEQMRAIQRELGRDDHHAEVAKLREQVAKSKMTPEAVEKAEAECRRLEQMQSTTPEAAISRNYVECLVSLPWHAQSKDSVSLEQARSILDASHARMKKPKERIIEFLAAKKFAKDKLSKSPIICLAGPPGVGKTSLASTVAKALGRKMVRISLGGIRDEAEIRGHRRTYIGALPGKIIQAMRKAKVQNPVIVLDEIDKMAMDFRGDPASALLEVLDPEQNKSFVDHFVEVEYDLSKVMFITTANVVDAIPYPLLDRMEIIQLSGYTLPEKTAIAREFLLPKLLSEHALKASQIVLSDEMLVHLIEGYTREAGVRQLGRLLAAVLRKSIQDLLLDTKKKKITITKELVEKWFGSVKFRLEKRPTDALVGLATGLAWTEVGGDVLEIEVAVLKGKGGLTLTGQLGEVMQESAQAAMSYIRSRSKELKIAQRFFTECDVHLHLPEGAIPKDGPSAGITITTALTSAFTGRPVRAGVAMSGEVTLRGRVLAVGGLREKVLAAARVGIHTVIVSHENESDIKEFIGEIENPPKIIYVKTMDEVLAIALDDGVAPAAAKAKKKAAPKKKKAVSKKGE